VLIAVIFWPRGGAVQAGEALLDDFDPAQIGRISIEDADGNSTTLAKSGQSWVLPDADDYPADAARIDPLLQNLAAIQTDRLVTQTAASHGRLGVAGDDFERRITLENEGGGSTVLYVGSASGARATHVRLDGQDEVFLTGEISSFDVGAAPGSWIDTAYLSLPGDQISGMRLDNANGTLEFVKDAVSGEWSLADLPEGRQANSAKISSLVTRLASQRMVQPLGNQEQPEYGFDQPAATVTLVAPGENETTRTYQIEIGAKDTGGSDYIVRSSESEYIVRVAGASLEELLSGTAEDFLQAEPTPTPGS
jgi:hypothetical protein